MNNWNGVYPSPAQLLQKLIRFDTTNPPGNERACVDFIAELLRTAGIEPTILALEENRPNLIARIPGDGQAPPLLLQGHVDVVTTEGQQWRYPPFEGKIADNFIWGRGALDMKGGVAMMVAACLRLVAEGLSPPGDVILAILSDEEALGHYGARFLVENHPEQFAGIRFALGEFGGFSMDIAGRRFYPIMVAEKQHCHIRLTIHGPAGHGSMPVRGGAMAELGRILQKLDQTRLPVHVTPVARQMFGQIAAAVSFPTGLLLRLLLSPGLTDWLLDRLGARTRVFDPLLHHTVSPTILHGSSKINVIPGEVSLEMDGRILPGYTPEHLLAELRPVVGDQVAIEVLGFEPGPADTDMGLFDTLASVLREADPEGVPIPLLLAGVTDARLFSRLGIQTYGFLPMKLPANFNFSHTIHAADERVPVAALDFGAAAIYEVLQRFGK